MLVVSTGCPAGIGPEVSVAAAARVRRSCPVLVGEYRTILAAAEATGVRRELFVPYDPARRSTRHVQVLEAGPRLSERDRRPGRPSRRAGVAQLEYVNAAYRLAREAPGRALVTGPVSKAVIAGSGFDGARGFLGHTEWLRDLDGASTSVMCFASPRLVTSLATTHVPIGELPRRLTEASVADASYWLARLLQGLGHEHPRLAVCSLNPHAGESELLGHEERQAIVPGIRASRRRLRGKARIEGPIGAETAYRKAYAGGFEGVVAMYHDQATIPMKLVAFGEAVNVTMGLSIVRTSVDHGTGYDIAWQGSASPSGMLAALRLAQRLTGS